MTGDESFWRGMASELAMALRRTRRYGRDAEGAATLRRYEEAKAASRPQAEQQTLGGGAT